MNQEIKIAISEFFVAVSRLKDLGVFRSDKYLGDLGEYICQHFFSLELASSGRQPGYDGIGGDGLVQVKFHGSATRTNIDLGNPEEYQVLFIVLGPHSLLRNATYTGEFLVYRMSAQDVLRHRNSESGTYSCGREPFSAQPIEILNLA